MRQRTSIVFVTLALAALAVSCSIGAVGCGRAGGGKTIALVPKAMDSEFWLAVGTGAREAAANRGDVTLSIVAPDREINIDQQVSILEDQLRRGVSALIVAPTGSAQVVPVLEQAAARKIPVILVDTDAPFAGKASYIGTDNRAGGALAARHIISTARQGPVALIHGVPGNQSQDDRAAGFEEALKQAPAVQIVARQPANSERSLGMTVMENILTAHPDLKAVFATNDQMALGAMEAVEARGLGGKIAIVGFDATQEAVRAIQEGKMSASVAQRPSEMGRRSVEAALALIDGKQIEPRIDTGTELVTRQNAAAYVKK